MPEITVELPEDAYDRLEETAKAHEISVEQAVQRAIRRWNEKPHSDDELEEVLGGGKSFDSASDPGPPLGEEDKSE